MNGVGNDLFGELTLYFQQLKLDTTTLNIYYRFGITTTPYNEAWKKCDSKN